MLYHMLIREESKASRRVAQLCKKMICRQKNRRKISTAIQLRWFHWCLNLLHFYKVLKVHNKRLVFKPLPTAVSHGAQFFALHTCLFLWWLYSYCTSFTADSTDSSPLECGFPRCGPSLVKAAFDSLSVLNANVLALSVLPFLHREHCRGWNQRHCFGAFFQTGPGPSCSWIFFFFS